MRHRMSQTAYHELISSLGPRYSEARWDDKRRILDEFTAVIADAVTLLLRRFGRHVDPPVDAHRPARHREARVPEVSSGSNHW